MLIEKRERIALQEQRAQLRADLKFVSRAFLGHRAGNTQTPLPMSFRIGLTRPSQLLKSPTTLTRCAFGAQTAK